MKSTVLLALLAATAIHAQPVTLKGITQVQVGVQFTDGEGTGRCTTKVLAKNYGLLEDPIRTETELRLREAGLLIGPSGVGPVLRVDVTACPSMIHVGVQLDELLVVRGRRAIVTTWVLGAMMEMPSEGSEIREKIREYVAEFLNKWLADNGK